MFHGPFALVHMKLEGVLAEALLSIAPDVYGPTAFTNDKGILVIYVRLTQALYGCLKSSLQWHKQLSKVLFDEGFEIAKCTLNIREFEIQHLLHH